MSKILRAREATRQQYSETYSSSAHTQCKATAGNSTLGFHQADGQRRTDEWPLQVVDEHPLLVEDTVTKAPSGQMQLTMSRSKEARFRSVDGGRMYHRFIALVVEHHTEIDLWGPIEGLAGRTIALRSGCTERSTSPCTL